MQLSTTFRDPDVLDTHRATVIWGDGSQSSAQISSGTISDTHTYADNGVYAVEVLVTDNSGAVGRATTQANIVNSAPVVTAAVTSPTGRNPNLGESVAIAGSFTDPGFSNPFAGTVESFVLSIDWGDGQSEQVVPTVSMGTSGVSTSGTFAAGHAYASTGVYSVVARVQDDDGGVGTTTLSVRVGQPAATKFFVVDQSSHATFRYDAAGSGLGSADLGQFNSRPRGIASNVRGDTYWVIDASKQIFVYSASGTLRGSWSPGDLNQPEDITTDGIDIWIVDAAKDRVNRYAGAATRLSGSQAPTSSFDLAPANGNATGMVTNGATIWITDKLLHGEQATRQERLLGEHRKEPDRFRLSYYRCSSRILDP